MAQLIIHPALQNLHFGRLSNDFNTESSQIKSWELESIQKELVSSKIHLMSKDRLIIEIKSCLSSLAHSTSDERLQKELNKIISKIESNSGDREWLEFEKHFDLLHSDFFKILKNKYPDLTISEVKLCSLIKIKLTTKEMAHYLNLSLRGIESQRYRLRKKLNIDNGTSLEDFFDQISGITQDEKVQETPSLKYVKTTPFKEIWNQKTERTKHLF